MDISTRVEGASPMKASRKLAHDIAAAVARSGLRAGDRYLSETDALREHRVGRGTYREALRLLEAIGVLSVRSGPSGGAIVVEPTSTHVESVFAFWVQGTHAPLRAVVELREAIDPAVAELAARNATAADVIEMDVDLADVGASSGDLPAFVDAHKRYWAALSRSTHNSLLARLSPALRNVVNSAGFTPDEPYREVIVEGLVRIHDAVRRGDSAGAGETMRALQHEHRVRLAERYPRQLERVVGWSTLADDSP